MGIVFDEVVGTVEPRQEDAPRPAGGEPAEAAGAGGGGLTEAAVAKWLKRRAWLLARRRAD